ncbi:MAG: hypothetical protein H0X36_14390 [Sphingomonadaceae bacterium]|nr:hypothetical protein [Sphingomonadaceae bacterium]
MTMIRPTTALSALALLAAPALAAGRPSKSEINFADQQVAHQRLVAARAAQSGDVATIAEARAKLHAARAVAWGRRHPARAPTGGVVAR